MFCAGIPGGAYGLPGVLADVSGEAGGDPGTN